MLPGHALQANLAAATVLSGQQRQSGRNLSAALELLTVADGGQVRARKQAIIAGFTRRRLVQCD